MHIGTWLRNHFINPLIDGAGAAVGKVEAEFNFDFPAQAYHEQVGPDLFRSSTLKSSQNIGWLAGMPIKGAVNLQLEDRPGDAALGKKYGFNALHVSIQDNSHPTDAQMLDVLNFYENPANKPCDIHCNAGIGRTSEVVAVIQVLCNGVPLETALADAHQHGMTMPNQEDFVRSFVAKARAGEIARVQAGDRACWVQL
jgi:hypothetical protein